MSEQRKTEIIAFCSGKGGTGKSLMCACFGYALLHGGQRVLMIDGDPATDGLSLFLLGPKGQDQVSDFTEQNTFIGALERFETTGSATFEPRAIHRLGEDHGVSYSAIISGKGLYGEGVLNLSAVPDLNRSVFRAGIRHLFDQLRKSGEYDYVLVDTRGGFAFESTDLCALADSFIVITEPDYTSFYQDRNLVSYVSAAAHDVGSPSLLRAMIVNKAVDEFPKPGKPLLDTLEVLFRDQLVKEFPVRYQDTHAVPVSMEALLAYKAQRIPYRSAPEAMFCLATLAAFSDILQLVTSRWSVEQVTRWNALSDTVSQAVQRKQEAQAKEEQARIEHEEEFDRMRTAVADGHARLQAIEREGTERQKVMQHGYEVKVASLERELEQRNLQYEREFARSEALITTTIAQAGGTTATYPGVGSKTGSRPVLAPAPQPGSPAAAWAEQAAAALPLYTRRDLRNLLLAILVGAVLIVAVYLWLHRAAAQTAVPGTRAAAGEIVPQTEVGGDPLAGGSDPAADVPSPYRAATGTGTARYRPVAPGSPTQGSAAGHDAANTAIGAATVPDRTAASLPDQRTTPTGSALPPPANASSSKSGGTPQDWTALLGQNPAALHAQAAYEASQERQVILLCRAADLAPNSMQYVKDCDLSKATLLNSDRQSLKIAQEASVAGQPAKARQYARYVSSLDADLYRQAQLLLARLSGSAATP